MEYPLTHFLDDLLGTGEKSSGSNRRYSCPFPGCATRPSKLSGEKKLEIDLETTVKQENKYHCWSCGTKGKTIRSLLKVLKCSEHRFIELSNIIKYTDKGSSKLSDDTATFDGTLPVEYKFLGDITKKDLTGRHALQYLKERGITEEDIYKYSIGYCENGRYHDRIIIPSYDEKANINYFIARSFDKECPVKWRYLNPKASRDIIPFELFINWEEPLIICEGGFDLIAIKRNVVCLMDKVIGDKLMKKIIESNVKKIYIAIDKDALTLALDHCKTFMDHGKKVYFVNLDSKDPSEMGFISFTKLIQQAQLLTNSKLMKLKLGVW